MIKRFFDITICILVSPFALLVCIFVGLMSFFMEREFPFFSQKRVGLKRREFTIYKLRTMSADTIELGTHQISQKSVTRVGAILRSTKLDELPQLWNVFLGQMSLVGPRPCLLGQDELIKEREKRGVFNILPGITGLSQVKGIDMSMPEVLAESDAEYMRNYDFFLDIKILAMTLVGKGSGDKIK